jgi:hypothetical protein
MRLQEFAKMGYSNTTLRYPYRVKTKNGKVKLVHDPSKGLSKLSEAPVGNRGDVSEILTAVALFLLFKDKTVDEDKILSFVMENVAQQSPNIDIELGPNQKGDVFRLQFPVPASVQSTIFDPKNYEKGGLYVNIPERVAFTVSNEFTKQVNFIHDNKRKDAVDIAVVGAKGGKVDVIATVSYIDAQGKEKTEPLKDMEISLKIGSAQFDQMTGKEMVAKFSTAFGIDAGAIAKQTGLTQALAKIEPLALKITDTQIKKIKSISREDADKILAQIEQILYGQGKGPMYRFYRSVANTLNTQLAGKQGEKKERKIIADALGNVIKKGIGKVSMLEYQKNGYTVLNQTAINKLVNLMKTTDLRAEYAVKAAKEGAVARPYLEFYDTKDNEKFFHVRNYMNQYAVLRNTLEQGKKFSQFKRTVKYNK